MPRPPSAKSIIRNLKKDKRQFEPKTPIATEMFLPNNSGTINHPEMKPLIIDHPHQDITTTASPEFDGLDVDLINIDTNTISSAGDIEIKAGDNLLLEGRDTAGVNIGDISGKIHIGNKNISNITDINFANGTATIDMAGATIIQTNGEDLAIVAGDELTLTDNNGSLTLSQVIDAHDHISTDGSSHTFINQDVTITGTPRFRRLGLNSAVDATTLLKIGDITTDTGDETIFSAGLLSDAVFPTVMDFKIIGTDGSGIARVISAKASTDTDGVAPPVGKSVEVIKAIVGGAGAEGTQTVITQGIWAWDAFKAQFEPADLTNKPTGGTFNINGLHIFGSPSNYDGATLNFNGIKIENLNDGNAIKTGTGLVSLGDEVEVVQKIKLTSLGGYAIKLTNKTGSNSVAGQLVQTDTTTNDAVNLSGVNSDDTIGIILDSGVSDGTDMWVVVYGIADVLMDAVGSVRGDRIISAPVGGFATPWNVGGAVATHFQEIGHCIETRGGAGLARCVLHFN